MKKLKKANNFVAQNNEKSFMQILKCSFLHTLFFFLTSAFIVLLASLFLFNSNDPTKFLSIILKIILYLTVFLFSIALAKKLKQRYLISGLVFGLMISIIFFILSHIGNSENSLFWIGLIIIFSVSGSLLGYKLNDKPHKKRHR